jgi:glutamate carboxypeptidase
MQSKYYNYLTEKFPSYLEIYKKMIGINSWTYNKSGVDELSSYTAEIFKELGFTAEKIPSVNHEFASHLFLRRSAKNLNAMIIGCVSHLDTVFSPDEEIKNDFNWKISGDKIYGPGTNDIKGGTLVIYMILDALNRISTEVFESVNWMILLDATEETESDDFGDLCCEKLAGAEACLVFESGDADEREMKLVISRKGRATFKIETSGRGSHAGSAHESGANALLEMAGVIRQVESFTDYEKSLTFNTGIVKGGSALNRVPHHAEALIEMRAFSPEAFLFGKEKILKLNGAGSVKSADGKFTCTVSVELLRENPAWPENEKTISLYKKFEKAANILGYKLIPEARGGLSDGNFLWNCVPVIDGLGPAGDNCHCSEKSADGSKDQEYAVLSSFIPKALLTIHALLNLTGRKL